MVKRSSKQKKYDFFPKAVFFFPKAGIFIN